LGIHLAKLGKFDEARKAQEAIALEPNSLGAWIDLGATYEKQQMQSEFIDYQRCRRLRTRCRLRPYEQLADRLEIVSECDEVLPYYCFHILILALSGVPTESLPAWYPNSFALARSAAAAAASPKLRHSGDVTPRAAI